MHFRARLRRGSPIWRIWTGQSRVGGEIAGVPFRWIAGNDFVTGTLEAAQIEVLRLQGDVDLEMTGLPAAFDAPAPRRADPPQPPRMRPPTQRPVPPSAWKNR